MSQYRVLFLDIDGTMINSDDTIEESTKISAKHKTTDVDHSGVYNGLKSLGLID